MPQNADYMPNFKRDRLQQDAVTGSDLTFDYVVHRLKEADFNEAAPRLGFMKGASVNEVKIDFLGRHYVLCNKADAPSCEAEDGAAGNVHHKSILCYYALSAFHGSMTGERCLLGNFSHGVFAKSLDTQKTKNEWSAVFDGVPPEEQSAVFAKVAAMLGMKAEDTPQKWSYALLPKVPVSVVFYEEDEDYPPMMRIYYDKTAIEVFDFEPLAVLHGCLTHELLRLAGECVVEKRRA